MDIEKEKYDQLTLADLFEDNRYLLKFKTICKEGVICVCVEGQDRAE